MELGNPLIGSLDILNRAVRPQLNVVNVRGAVTLLYAQRLGHSLRMVNKVTLVLKYEGRMVVVAAHVEPYARVAENLSLILKRPHRIVAHHVADAAISGISFCVFLHKIRTIGIIILAAIFKDAAVLEHARRVNQFCLAVDADHICAKFGNPCRLRIVYLLLRRTCAWDAAAKVNVRASVIIHQHCRVEAPYHALASWRLSGNQRLANRVFPRP